MAYTPSKISPTRHSSLNGYPFFSCLYNGYWQHHAYIYMQCNTSSQDPPTIKNGIQPCPPLGPSHALHPRRRRSHHRVQARGGHPAQATPKLPRVRGPADLQRHLADHAEQSGLQGSMLPRAVSRLGRMPMHRDGGLHARDASLGGRS